MVCGVFLESPLYLIQSVLDGVFSYNLPCVVYIGNTRHNDNCSMFMADYSLGYLLTMIELGTNVPMWQ